MEIGLNFVKTEKAGIALLMNNQNVCMNGWKNLLEYKINDLFTPIHHTFPTAAVPPEPFPLWFYPPPGGFFCHNHSKLNKCVLCSK